jgi:hypothetical protein
MKGEAMHPGTEAALGKLSQLISSADGRMAAARDLREALGEHYDALPERVRDVFEQMSIGELHLVGLMSDELIGAGMSKDTEFGKVCIL